MLLYQKCEEERIVIKKNKDNNLSLFLCSKKGEPLAKLSIDGKDSNLQPDEIILKDYSENSGIIDQLIDSSMLKPTDRFILVGNRLCPVCKVLT